MISPNTLILARRGSPNLQQMLTCTLETCDVSESWYGYRPSLVANAVIMALSALSLMAYAVQGILSRRRFTRFTTVMTIGALGETLGYLGRALSHQDPFGKVSTSSLNGQ